jgi:signal transduction histidine kinase/ActR/RegA family two-component response regulator
VVSALIGDLYFSPIHALFIYTPGRVLQILLFAAEGTIISWLCAQLRQATQSSNVNAAEARLRRQELASEIIERKRLEEKCAELLAGEQAARAEAENASRLKDEFLATVSHELRTPLNAILGWAQMMRGKLDESTEVRARESIERNARAQARLIDRILDVSRIISGKLRLNLQKVELTPVIQAAIEAVRLSAEGKGVRLDVVLDSGTGPVSGDANRLQQIAWNLLSNAIKFTSKGGSVHVRLQRIHSQVALSVTDTGCGIGGQFVPYVFDAFRQGDAATSRKHGGLGLGLAIVRRLVELHGGTVRAESRGEGEGATFTVCLPIRAVDSVTEGEIRAKDIARGPFSLLIKGVKVLIVDDEADARDLLHAVLSRYGAEVLMCASVAEALVMLQRFKPDVLVSDVGMPEEDGYSLIKKVRALAPEQGGKTQAIALTAYTGIMDRMRALSAGFQMFLPKPVEPVELVAAVGSLAGVAERGEAQKNYGRQLI